MAVGKRLRVTPERLYSTGLFHLVGRQVRTYVHTQVYMPVWERRRYTGPAQVYPPLGPAFARRPLHLHLHMHRLYECCPGRAVSTLKDSLATPVWRSMAEFEGLLGL